MQLKQMGMALITAGVLSANAYANEAAIEPISAQPQAAFTETDLSALFEQDAKPMQLAALSGQEMGETEGALAPPIIGASYAWTAFRVSGFALGAYRAIGPAYRGGRVLQVMRNNNPVFRIDNHRNPYTSNLHFHSAPNMSLHRPWYAPWRGR